MYPASRKGSSRLAIATFVFAAFTSQACGGDEGGGGGGDPAAKKAADDAAKKKKEADAKKKAAKKKGKKVEEISFIRTLEQIHLDKDGKPLKLRHHLVDLDFSSLENRDPFRSFVLPQMAATKKSAGTEAPAATGNDKCKKEKMIASSFEIDDLDLIGVIRRGNTRQAMFRDTRGVGHLVVKGNCIGREKGKVVEIADSLVCYEPTEEQATETVTTIVVEKKKCIPLHPDDITDLGVDDLGVSEDERATSAPSGAPPSLPAPSLPPPSSTPAVPPPGGS